MNLKVAAATIKMRPSIFQRIRSVFYRPEINFADISRNFRNYLTCFCESLKVWKFQTNTISRSQHIFMIFFFSSEFWSVNPGSLYFRYKSIVNTHHSYRGINFIFKMLATKISSLKQCSLPEQKYFIKSNKSCTAGCHSVF